MWLISCPQFTIRLSQFLTQPYSHPLSLSLKKEAAMPCLGSVAQDPRWRSSTTIFIVSSLLFVHLFCPEHVVLLLNLYFVIIILLSRNSLYPIMSQPLNAELDLLDTPPQDQDDPHLNDDGLRRDSDTVTIPEDVSMVCFCCAPWSAPSLRTGVRYVVLDDVIEMMLILLILWLLINEVSI